MTYVRMLDDGLLLAGLKRLPDSFYAPSAVEVQREGGAVEEIRPGDIVWFPPGEKHWHGATATHAMSHFAIQEKLNGSPVDWLEHVGDADFAAPQG